MNACDSAGIPFGIKVKGGFVVRDLRTTAATLMAKAGVPDVYRRALLGHLQQGMDRHYVHPDFDKDLRAAMENVNRRPNLTRYRRSILTHPHHG